MSLQIKPEHWGIVLLLAGLLLAIYGDLAWYFPSTKIVSIAIVLGVTVGLWLTYWTYKKANWEAMRKRKFGKATLLLFALSMGSYGSFLAIGYGIPAYILIGLEPTKKLVVQVAAKEGGRRQRRRCDNRIELSGIQTAFKPYLCISEPLFERIRVGHEVSLTVREDFFGLRIYEIIPID